VKNDPATNLRLPQGSCVESVWRELGCFISLVVATKRCFLPNVRHKSIPRRDTVLLEDLLQFRYQMIKVFNLSCQLIQKDLSIRLNDIEPLFEIVLRKYIIKSFAINSVMPGNHWRKDRD
jgi:hypothetical protein